MFLESIPLVLQLPFLQETLEMFTIMLYLLVGEYIGWVYTNNNRWERLDTLAACNSFWVFGIYSGSNYVGFSSNIDDFISGIGATIRTVFDSTVGITTVTFDSEPLRVGISTGLGAEKVFAGIATEINFIGYGISITAVQNFNRNRKRLMDLLAVVVAEAPWFTSQFPSV